MQAPSDLLLLDQQDPLASLRERFELPEGVVYLDGNSLGPLVKGVPEAMENAIRSEWGKGLIRSWNDANWYPAPQRVGGLIASLIGAQEQEVVACDSTSVNLFKVLVAAIRMRPRRSVIVCEADNFPSDGYIAQGVAELMDARLVQVPQHEIKHAIVAAGDQLAAVVLTHVNYKTGRMYDMNEITFHTHQQGGLMIWDLAHSAGVIPVKLNDCGVDFAVGCGYKYLNGGPGAPAFVYVREDHLRFVKQPLQGWHGHAAPFAFTNSYEPHAKIDRMLVGTAAQLSLIALEAGLKAYEGVSLLDVREKSQSLTGLFIDLIEAAFPNGEFTLASPRDAAWRGSQVSFSHPQGYAIVQALIARGVIGDYREPNILRFGFAPLYVRYQDVWAAVEAFKQVMTLEEWRLPQFAQRKSVT